MEDVVARQNVGYSLLNWMKRFSGFRRFLVILPIARVFLGFLFTRQGLFSANGRQQIWGKARRSFISLFPAWARSLQAKHGLTGGCVSCGASCNLMFRCPHWVESTHLCGAYEDRPEVCRLFPITPKDISDRTIARNDVNCGFTFTKP